MRAGIVGSLSDISAAAIFSLSVYRLHKKFEPILTTKTALVIQVDIVCEFWLKMKTPEGHTQMNSIAIIPARGGSKRIPRKNIKPFLGKPIIAYSIETAINSGSFDEIMVSTDDEEIAEIARKYGAKVPFLRSAETSDDYATTADVIKEVLNEYEARNCFFKLFCCIYPTAPLITKENLINAKELLVKGKYSSIFPVVQFSYPIQRSLKMYGNKIKMFWPENLNRRSQDLEPAYHDSGQFYWMKVVDFKNSEAIFTDNSAAIVLSSLFVQDIDNEDDFSIAEIKYKILHKNEH